MKIAIILGMDTIAQTAAWLSLFENTRSTTLRSHEQLVNTRRVGGGIISLLMLYGVGSYLPSYQLLIFLTLLCLCFSALSLLYAIRMAQRAKEAETKAERESLFLKRIATVSPSILYIFDVQRQRNVYLSGQVLEALGYIPENFGEAEIHPFAAICHPDDRELIVQNRAKFTMLEAGDCLEIEFRVQDAQGEWRWLQSRETVFMRDEQNAPSQVLGVAQDITNRKTQEEMLEMAMVQANESGVRLELQKMELEELNTQLENIATTDGLTGLKNHRTFQEFIRTAYASAERHTTPLSVILLDVDHFKKFNDSFGHPAGDEVLKNVASALQQSARVGDLVARYGGEEFVLVLPYTDSQGAMAVAERVREAIECQPWALRQVTASVGVATLSPATESVSKLIAAADEALYASKHGGRNRVTHYNTLGIPSEIERAIA